MRALDPRLVGRARPARTLLGVDVALGVATAVVVIVQAALLAHVAAGAFHGSPAGGAVGVLAIAFCARGALAWGTEVAGRRAASGVLSELRLAVAERRLRAQPLGADGVQAGEVAAVAVQGIGALEAYYARYLPQVVLACVVPVALVGWVAAIDLEAAAVMVATLPLVPVFMWLIGRSTEARTLRRREALRVLSTHFLDVVRGLPTLRAFNRARAQAATLEEVGERYRAATMGTLRVGFLSGSVLELAATLAVALVAVTVGVRLAGGSMALEPALTVLVLAPEVYLPLRRLGAEYHASADGLAVAARMLELLDAPAEAPAGGALVAPSPAVAGVRFDDVSFAYPARPGRVLEGLSFTLEPGETLALVGESGAGKSTVAALLLGLVAPTSGRVLAGDADLSDCRLDAWRANVAWVPQHPALLRASVADNIRLGAPDAQLDRVRDAAALAGADAFIRALPDGYQTVVGDGGRPVSAGERRRIALARAFLRDAPLVVLDEPTADLDDESAAIVADAVGRLGAGRTVLVIAHRPELVARADRVVRLSGGAAAEVAVLEAA